MHIKVIIYILGVQYLNLKYFVLCATQKKSDRI
jgi:hypothetical protein